MSGQFDWDIFGGELVKGNLRAAMDYLSRFPEKSGWYEQYVSRFQEERYLTYDVDGGLNEILLAYQKYYRDAFYLGQSREEAARRLQGRLAEHFGVSSGTSLDELEALGAEAFREKGFYALTGLTSGWYGPYVWWTEELRHYPVELPEGVQDYAVKFLDGFLMKSWLDYLSFGRVGTGGWSNGDGLIHCVKDSYDTESERFRVSLLKHEAQHAMDLARYPGMSSQDLEYRAKLVELIYTQERSLLAQFLGEAAAAHAGSGHSLASERIIRELETRLGKPRAELPTFSAQEIRTVSLALFRQSIGEMEQKYSIRFSD